MKIPRRHPPSETGSGLTAEAIDRAYMARALRLARRGLYSTSPNPRVGSVIVRAGNVVAEGWHRRAGDAHAEIIALKAAGDAARGSTIYVTLEPCCHTGRTPPCTEALIDAGVKRVVCAMADPNPKVAGRGITRLREAGIEVDAGIMEAEAGALNPGFVSRMKSGRPWVRIKIAATLDAQCAMRDGESRWITSPAARKDVQRLRAQSCAVLTGIGTVLADDPRLNVRWPGAVRQPLRVIVDSSVRTPASARMLNCAAPVLIFAALGTGEAGLHERGVEVRELPGRDGRVDLQAMLRHLAQRGVNEILVESGPTLNSAFIKDGLADEIVLYIAPKLLGDQGQLMLRAIGPARLSEHVGLHITDLRQVGPDIRIRARPTPNRKGEQ